jgi:hypothetical protein
MSPNKTLYIRDDDAPVWDQADVLAKVSKQSLSQIVTTALQRFMAGPPDIHVNIVDPDPARAPNVATFADSGGRPILEYPYRYLKLTGWRVSTTDDEAHFLPGDALNPPIREAREWLRQKAQRESAGGIGEITVEVGEPLRTVGFRGRWLVEPDSDGTRSSEPTADAGAYWGVALTARGRIAVFVAHCNERFPPQLDDFETLDDAKAADLPEDIYAMAAHALGSEHVSWLDI